MSRRLKESFTLTELIIVVVIVSVLATFALPAYFNAQKRIIDKEARTQLKLIQSAEETYQLENQFYYPCSANLDCNSGLSLELTPSAANGGNWNYSVNVSGPDFTADALGSKTDNDWEIGKGDNEAQAK